MDVIRRSIRIRRLDRMIHDLDIKIDHINEARGRLSSVPSRGFLKAQREYLATEVDEILKVRDDMIQHMTGTVKLQFAERSRSFGDLRTNIYSGQKIRSGLLQLCCDFLDDVEADLKLQKAKTEEEKENLDAMYQRRYGFMFRLTVYVIVHQMVSLLRSKFNL